MVIINDLVLKKTPYIIPTDEEYINLATIQNYNTHIDIDDNKINYYPSKTKQYNQLLKLISNYNKCDIHNILLTHGSGEALKLILNTFSNSDTKILIPVPNYPGFIHDAELKSINITKIYFNGLIDDVLILEQDIIENDIIYLSIPNLPLGYELNKQSLLYLIKKYKNKLFIIDEAYIEYGKNESYIKYINFENIIITRTFSKAFAIAGARLGYIVCHSKLIKFLNIHYCTKTVTNYAIKCGLNVMNNLEYYLNNVQNDLKNWENFYNKCKLYMHSNDIINNISYYSGAYCLLYTEYPEYIINIFKSHGYLVRDKSNDVKFKCIRITLTIKSILDDILELIKKINGYCKYDTYYIDLDETIRENETSDIYPGIQNALNIIHKKSKIIIITNNSQNHDEITKYLNNNNLPYDQLISPFKNLNISDIEFTNGWFIRNDKLYIIKFPIITQELFKYINNYKHIYIIEKSLTYNNIPFIGTFLNILVQQNIIVDHTIIGKDSLIIENINKNSIIIGDSIIDYRFAFNNNIFYYNNINPQGTLDFLNHKALLDLSRNHTELLDLLYRIIKIFKILNLKYWAECGTLLGAVRYNKILPWDEDCDLGILKKDENILLDNIELFKKYRLRIQKNKSTNEYWQIDNLYDTIGVIDPDLHIDIFLFYEENNLYKNTDYRFQNPDFEIGHCNIFYTKDELFPLSSLPFYDINIPVPNKYNKVLKRSLGDNYMTHCIIKKYIDNTDIKLLECNLDNKFNNKFDTNDIIKN